MPRWLADSRSSCRRAWFTVSSILTGSRLASERAEVEVLESEGHGAVEPATGREALWYPVGVALALLAASGAFLLCCPGRWIG